MSNSLERRITLPSVLKFTLPSMVMMVVMSLYTVVDGTFVSRLVGTDAFSAVNITYPLSSVVIGIGTMFGAGTTAIVSRKLGEGRQREARQIFTFIILITMLLGVAFSACCLLFLEPIIYALGANEAVFDECYAYALPLILFFVADILQCQFQSLYVANGKPQIGLIVTILGGLTNVALDYLFIARMNMGISGAALATGIGYSVPALFGLCYFAFNRKGAVCFVRPEAAWRELRYAASNGSSEMVTYLSTSVTTFLYNIIMMRMLGQNGVAAIAILLYLDFVLIAVSMGYSMGAAPLFAYNYGCGDYGKLRRLFRLSLGLSLVSGAVVAAGTFALARPLAGIFSDPGEPVYELAVAGLRIYAAGYLFKGFNVFSSAMFTAFGDGRVSAAISFMRTLLFLTVSLVALPVLLGVDGVWLAAPAAEALAAALAAVLTLRHRVRYHYGGRLAG